MTKKTPKEPHRRPTREQLDERVVIPLDPETAIEALLKVDPESEPIDKQRPDDDT